MKYLRLLNGQLADSANALEAELKRTHFRVEELANLIRQVNLRAARGPEAVGALGGALGKDEPGGRMASIYRGIIDSAGKTLDASVNNPEAYHDGAVALIGLIVQLPALQKAARCPRGAADTRAVLGTPIADAYPRPDEDARTHPNPDPGRVCVLVVEPDRVTAHRDRSGAGRERWLRERRR